MPTHPLMMVWKWSGGEMIINAREIKRIRQALYLAIDYQASLIDAHRVSYARVHERTIPAEWKNYMARAARDIKAFKVLLTKIKIG